MIAHGYPALAGAADPVPDGAALSSAIGRETLLARIPPLAAIIAEGAAPRERDHVLPFEAFRLLREARLGALRVPAHCGGPGGSILDYIRMIMTLAAADSNVAHALRSHFNFTETLVVAPEGPRSSLWLGKVLEGALFGGAHTELGTARPGMVTTRLTRHGESFRLNGRKWYATGTAFADYASFSANDEAGRFVSVLLPLTRPGIQILDDWDGMGQRLTASGGVEFENVEVLAEEISAREPAGFLGRHTSSLRQLHLAACTAGIVRNVLADAVLYVRNHARSAAHSTAPTAREDPFVQQIVGELAAQSHAIDTLIEAGAAALDRGAAVLIANDPDAETVLRENALTIAKTQVIASKLALKAAESLFEVGGGSATSRKHGFDRHWRNIRTLLNHNPLLHKARVVGDFHLNGTTTHLEEGKVF